jgi:aminopeptidase N
MADFWLREAAGAFAEVLRREAEGGRPAAHERLAVLRDAYLGLREASLDRPLAELEPTGRGDTQVARTKGAWVLWMLRQAVGPLSYREIAAGPDGLPATTEALKRAVSAGDDSETQHWDVFFDYWVYSSSLPQYRLLSATVKGSAGAFAVTLKVSNRGTGTIPAPLVVQSEEGARHEFSLAVPGGGTSEVRYSMITRPVAAAVDPEGDLLQPEPSGAWQVVKARRWPF